MAGIITAPRRGVENVSFEVERADALAPERGGNVGAVALGFPLWQASWQLTGDMLEDASDEWRAFADRLQGSTRVFFGYDHSRRLPKAHPGGFATMALVGGGVFSGAASGWSQTIDADGEAALALTGLPSGLMLSRGDYVGFRWDAAGSASGTNDRRALVRVVESARANAAGAASVTVYPAVPTGVVPLGATAHLDAPGCMMRAVPGEARLGAVGLLKTIAGGTINAIQVLRP